MDQVRSTMEQLLAVMVKEEASDLHISAGSPPQLRIDGSLVPLRSEALSAKQTKALCLSLLTDEQRERFEAELELDFSLGIEGLARFRGNIFVQRDTVAGAFRKIAEKIPSFEELGLPPTLQELAELPRGLVLITGPTGSGKSTTLAALIHYINKRFRKHIITIEDPIEYLHVNNMALINQREVGSDTESYRSAMRMLLRQDPDVILLGELRDLNSVETAMLLAETGHLVLSTLHTNSCIQTINRIIDVFPPAQQEQVRTQLSFVLEAVICQQLLPLASKRGRVPALEVMIANMAIRNLIREDKVHQIYSTMQLNKNKTAMITMNQSLYELYQARFITLETALTHAGDLNELKKMLTLE